MERQRLDVADGDIGFHCRFAGGADLEGQVHNIGTGGLAVSIAAHPALGDVLEFELRLGGATVTGQGRVTWCGVGEDPRMGLCFLQLDDYARSMIELWLKQSPRRDA